MHARVAFKKQKVVHERVMWLVSVFTDPKDIVDYDKNTMSRLGTEIYKKGSKSKRQIIIREILDKMSLGKSNLTIDEHKRINNLKAGGSEVSSGEEE